MKAIDLSVIGLLLVILILVNQTVISDAVKIPEPATESIKSSWYDTNKNFIKPTQEQLKLKLTKLQFNVTQKDATERPYKNEYWDNKHDGIYVDIVSGEPLFSSTDKYKSGTGWPSFTRPILNDAITYHEDKTLFAIRTELRSKLADSHLGHIFDDGPAPTGMRYCINSASLKFVPKEKLMVEGYGEFQTLFE